MSTRKAAKKKPKVLPAFPADWFEKDGWVSKTTLDRMQAILNRIQALSEDDDSSWMSGVNWALQIQNMRMPHGMPVEWYLNGRKWWHAAVAEKLCGDGTVELSADLRAELFSALCRWNESPLNRMSKLVHDIHAIELASTGLFKAEDLITEDLLKYTGLDCMCKDNVRQTVRDRLVKYAQRVLVRRGPVLLCEDSRRVRFDPGISQERLIYADAEDYLYAPENRRYVQDYEPVF